MKKALLIGNFGEKINTEVLLNLDILKRYKEKNYNLNIIDISGNLKKSKNQISLPITPNTKRKTGGVGWKFYISLIFNLIRFSFNSGRIHYITKAASRPSLFNLLVITTLGKIMLKEVFVTIHSDLYSFLGAHRSSWNGYPLLKISFSFADVIYCGDKNIKNRNLFYKNSPDKFKTVEFGIIKTDFEKINKDFNDFFKKYKKIIIIFLTKDRSSFAEEIFKIILNDSKKAGVVIISENKPLQDRKNILYIPLREKNLIKEAISNSSVVIEPAVCDGQEILPDLVCILRYPQLKNNILFLDKGYVLIKSDNHNKKIIQNEIFKH